MANGVQLADCRACHAAYSRAHRPRAKRRADMTPDERQKHRCRSYTRVLQARGRLPKGPCEVCGNTDAQNHHPDYSNPHIFKRLCRLHHVEADRQHAEQTWRETYHAQHPHVTPDKPFRIRATICTFPS